MGLFFGRLYLLYLGLVGNNGICTIGILFPYSLLTPVSLGMALFGRFGPFFFLILGLGFKTTGSRAKC